MSSTCDACIPGFWSIRCLFFEHSLHTHPPLWRRPRRMARRLLEELGPVMLRGRTVHGWCHASRLRVPCPLRASFPHNHRMQSSHPSITTLLAPHSLTPWCWPHLPRPAQPFRPCSIIAQLRPTLTPLKSLNTPEQPAQSRVGRGRRCAQSRVRASILRDWLAQLSAREVTFFGCDLLQLKLRFVFESERVHLAI